MLSAVKQVNVNNTNMKVPVEIRTLCPSNEDFLDYRGKLESIMEASSVPTFWLSLSVFVLGWKPSEQACVGHPPERTFPDKERIMKHV